MTPYPMRAEMMKALKAVENWAAVEAERQDAELQDLERSYLNFRNLEEQAKGWTVVPMGGNTLSTINRTANHLGQNILHLKEDIRGVSILGNEARKLLNQLASQSSDADFKSYAEMQGRKLGRALGRGLTVAGKRLTALEVENPRLRIVSYETVKEGLQMPGEHLKLPKGDYYLDERLQELRLVDDPHKAIRLNEFEVEWFKRFAH